MHMLTFCMSESGVTVHLLYNECACACVSVSVCASLVTSTRTEKKRADHKSRIVWFAGEPKTLLCFCITTPYARPIFTPTAWIVMLPTTSTQVLSPHLSCLTVSSCCDNSGPCEGKDTRDDWQLPLPPFTVYGVIVIVIVVNETYI